MTDVIRLTGLRARGRHGVYDRERTEGQEFVVDVALEVDPPRADELAETVDYNDLAGRLVALVEGEPVNLIETLAGRLARECLADPRVHAVTVTVHKPHAPIPHPFSDVSVTVRRSRA